MIQYSNELAKKKFDRSNAHERQNKAVTQAIKKETCTCMTVK